MVMEKLDSGKDVILEIDTQGALMVKESHPEGILIFILPPSLKVLKERITKRGTDSEEVISKRMKEAVKEISVADRYDYIVVNDELSVAVDTVKSIIKAERNKVDNNTIMKYTAAVDSRRATRREGRRRIARRAGGRISGFGYRDIY